MKIPSPSRIEPLEARIAPTAFSIVAQTNFTVEGDFGTHLVTFTVALDTPTQQAPLTVDYSTVDGTLSDPLNNANAGQDYDATSGTLTFAPGISSQTFTVTIHGDTTFEHDEFFSAMLSNPQGKDGQGNNVTISPVRPSATVEIQNDDATPTVLISPASVVEGNDPNNPNYLLFTISLTNASSQAISMTASTADGTATVADRDYTATTATITFAPGETMKTFSVPVIGDTKSEPDETITANLSGFSGNVILGPVSAAGTILTDDIRLAIGDAQVVEGNPGTTTNMAFTVTLDSATPNQAVTVHYATQDGTAVSVGTIAAGTRDYEPTSGTLSLMADASGHAAGIITVPVNGDSVPENNETFTVNLSNAAGIVISKSAGTGTITDDDPGLAISSASVTEGNLGDPQKSMGFTVALNHGPANQDVTVDFATQDGTAVSSGTLATGTNDYEPASGILTLHTDANGHATAPIVVGVNGDGVVENNEFFNVVLSNASNGIPITTGTGIGTIIDNDTHSLTIGDVNVVEDDAGHVDAVFVVTLNPAVTGTVTVNYATVDGTAISFDPALHNPLSDYNPQSGTLTFTPGQTTQTIVVPVLGDLVHEGTETFTVRLNGVVGASIANDTGLGTIIDNGDPVPTISLAPASVAEGNAGDPTAHLSFVATLSAPSQTPVTVDFATQDGTATTAGNDYVAKTGTITFDPGETTQTIMIDVIGDYTNEADETMHTVLSNAQGATLSSGMATLSATGTILNDDITASIAGAQFTEGDVNTPGTMTVTLSSAPVPGSTVTVNYALIAGTAHIGTDVQLHDPTVTSLTFNPGETTKTIALDIIGDTINEADETFTVKLTGATGAIIDSGFGADTGMGVIRDNDPVPTVSIADAHIIEGDSGTSLMNFTVSLSSVSGRTVTVNAGTVDGTAHFGSDYTVLGGQVLFFAPGVTTQTVSVPIIGDTVDEQTETFQVQLSSPTNAQFDPVHGAATGTIFDNDLRAVSISDASAAEVAAGQTAHMTFTVYIPTAATQDITLYYDTLDGTAKAGTDYTAVTDGAVMIPHGQTSATFTVDVTGKTPFTADKTFTIQLHDPVNATLADAHGTGKILDSGSIYKLVPVMNTNVEDDPNSATPKTVTFNVVRSGDTTLPGSVTFTTVDGTTPDHSAIAGSDYVANSGTLNFAAGETSKTITVTLRKDSALENTETFQVVLTGSSNGVLEDNTGAIQPLLAATAAIADNDALPTISINSPSISEGTPSGPGDTSTTTLTFTVSLSAPDQTQDVVVTYQTVDGTGEAGAISVSDGMRPADFVAVGPTLLTIPKGATSATFSVQVVKDAIYEADETFTVKLSNPVGGETFSPGGDVGTGTIKNDDTAPTITFTGANNGNLSLLEGNSGSTPATFTVQLSAPSEQTVTVDVNLGAGTATLGTDFTNTGVPATLTFAPQETSKTLTYSVLGDLNFEPDETFTVVLSNAHHASLGGSTVQATATIRNDDPTPTLAVNSVSQPEGNSGTTEMLFTVTLAGQTDVPVNVDYATSDGGAVSTGPAPDYQVVHGTLTFEPGEHTKTIAVPINGDTIKELDETFTVGLSNARNASITQGEGGGTILNDGDTTIGLTVGDAKIVEGDSGTSTATFTVQLSAASVMPITVDLATRNGTAVTGSDYVANTQTLTFNPGVTVQTFNVAILGDTTFEATESFFVDVKSSTGGAQVLNNEGHGTIYNDDLQIVNSQTVRYVDTDGDLAMVHITKGVLTTTGQHPVLNFGPVNAIGGRTLQTIDFTSNRVAFDHTDLSVTAAPQPGFSASGGQSDGRVDVGYIQGGIVQGNLLQIFDNIQFGIVTIEGDLGKIVAGKQNSAVPAVATLDILSHGAKGTSTGAPDNVSIFVGGAGQINDGGDWNGILESIGGTTGNIGNLTIKGVLRGDSTDDSGQIFFTGQLVSATIGSIIGGAGLSSGTISGNFKHAALAGGSSIGTVRVLGDVVGGDGNDSGRIVAPNIGTVIIGGNLTGGVGVGSGVIQAGAAAPNGSLGVAIVKGNVAGGTGANSGEIYGAQSIGTVMVRGSLLGGAGDDSGSIATQGSATSVSVLQDIAGGAGQRSGSVQIAKGLGNFQLGANVTSPGDLVGSTGASSGSLTVGRGLTAGTIFGSIEGGTGTASGGVNVGGVLTMLAIGRDLVGGSSSPMGPNGDATDVSASGFIAANRIGTLLVGHDIVSGINNGNSLVGSGTIRSSGDIASLVVGGNIVGSADVPVVIAAGGAAAAAKDQTIDALVVKGNTNYADILGGYSGGVSAANPLGTPLNPDAQMGTIQFRGTVLGTNVVAGVDPGVDGRFGTADDAVISGGLADDPAVQSRIAAMIIKGPINANADVFGIVAQVVGAASVSGQSVALRPTKADTVTLGDPKSNFILHELAGA